MKLAEALVERKAIKSKMEELKKRVYQNSKIQEGDKIVEDPWTLLEALKKETEKFETLVARINRTNNTSTLVGGDTTLMEAIVKKDMLHYLYMIHSNLADKATPTHERFSAREIKFLPTIEVGELRKKVDALAKEYRQLDLKIQESNWQVELL